MLNPHCLNELAQGSKLPDYEYPLSWGRHAMDQGSFVWAALKDIFGHYYLQNPPVALKTDGSWLASNLHLGHDIVEIIFVQVTGSGNDHFLRKVRSNEWGAFDDLPTGTDILGRVRIIVK